MRRLGVLLLLALLLALAVATERQLQGVPRPDPLGRELLFVPSADALRFVSFGNHGLVADILYMWAIQYYSVYSPEERFLYLETMLELMTDLDPRFYDAYAVGGLILGKAAERYPALRPSLERLYDKGIAAMPDDFVLAELAAWDFYTLFNDVQTAVYFAEQAASRPDAPNRILRVLGSWRDDNLLWSVDESIDYWRRAMEDAPNERERAYCRSHLDDVILARDRQELDPILQTFAAVHGRCPSSWSELARRGILRSAPQDSRGRVYAIDGASCTIVDQRKIRNQGG